MRSAADIASQVRTGRISAVDVVSDALAAAGSSHPSLNAFTLIDTSGAMRRAEAVDALVAEGKDPGPLAGVPIGLKDIIDDAGMPNSRGSSFPTELAERSSTVVRRLGAAGAVIIGRTGLHEFAFGFTSENPWFGPVRNPWDTETSAGGSSGGSASAVAARVVPLAIGTDTGGSVRVPAAMCGLFGLKVTHGRIPLTGVFPLVESLDTVGPITTCVDDLAISYAAMAGDDPADPWSQVRPVESPRAVSLGDVRLGVVRQWMTPPMSRQVRDGLDVFIRTAEAAGVRIEEIDVPHLLPPSELGAAIGPEIIRVHGHRYEEHPERFGADVAVRIEQARSGTADDVLVAERWGSAARATIARLSQGGFDALVAPTVGVMRKRIGDDMVDVDGTRRFHREVLAPFTAPINRIRVPALSAPVSGTGEPAVSIQLIGSMWSESSLLAIAGALEEARVLEAGVPPVTFGHTNR
jgi:Asp-tRNA(Asn)/Glu-tRNA(Gln) amidotransferase A subunit family amidase